MLKIIGFIFIFVILIITASLFNGIELKNISFNNINIAKLYLKYDKKLTIDIPQLIILDKSANSELKIETSFTVGYLNRFFRLNVTKFKIANTDLNVEGIIILDQKKIDFEKKTEITLENLNLQFDSKMKNLTAKKAFITLENNKINVTFQEPFYDDINLDNSKVHYNIDTDILKLNLKTTSLLTQTLKNGISSYGINIPVSQNSGTNQISADIIIPFPIDNNISIESSINVKNGNIEAFGEIFNVSNLDLKYNDLNLKGELNLSSYKTRGISFKDSRILYNVSLKNGVDANITTEKLIVQKNDIKLFLKNLSFQLEKDNIDFNSNLSNEDQTVNLDLNSTTNLQTKTSFGNIIINNLQHDNLINLKEKNIPYKLVFVKDIVLTNPTFDLLYFKNKNSKIDQLIIKKPKKILEAFKFIHVDDKNSGDGYIHIKSNEDLNTTIEIKKLNFNIDSSFFKSDSNTTKKMELPLFPTIDLTYQDSIIGYDQFKVEFDKINLKTNHDALNLHLIKDNATMDLNTKDNIISFNAHNLNDKYINTLINRELFEDGYININMYGEDINLLSGDVNFHQTTIRNVTIVNSLLTFINTTPAIVNPLLALPTLFRMAETGFDATGYYMKNGDGSFKYNLLTKELDIYDLFTNGKMSNFRVNSHLDYKNNNVKANVSISFLKDFSKVISYIPIVGYIIMGENGEFYTSVDITGAIDNPIIETHTIKESTQGVTGILQRVLELPLQPFNIETTKEQKEEHDKRVERFLK